MFSFETGQMSAIETGQKSSETSVLSQCTMLKSQKSQLPQYDNIQVSEISIVASQQSQLWQYHNVQVSDSPSGPKSTKMTRNVSRMVARS